MFDLPFPIGPIAYKPVEGMVVIPAGLDGKPISPPRLNECVIVDVPRAHPEIHPDSPNFFAVRRVLDELRQAIFELDNKRKELEHQSGSYCSPHRSKIDGEYDSELTALCSKFMDYSVATEKLLDRIGHSNHYVWIKHNEFDKQHEKIKRIETQLKAKHTTPYNCPNPWRLSHAINPWCVEKHVESTLESSSSYRPAISTPQSTHFSIQRQLQDKDCAANLAWSGSDVYVTPVAVAFKIDYQMSMVATALCYVNMAMDMDVVDGATKDRPKSHRLTSFLFGPLWSPSNVIKTPPCQKDHMLKRCESYCRAITILHRLISSNNPYRLKEETPIFKPAIRRGFKGQKHPQPQPGELNIHIIKSLICLVTGLAQRTYIQFDFGSRINSLMIEQNVGPISSSLEGLGTGNGFTRVHTNNLLMVMIKLIQSDIRDPIKRESRIAYLVHCMNSAASHMAIANGGGSYIHSQLYLWIMALKNHHMAIEFLMLSLRISLDTLNTSEGVETEDYPHSTLVEKDKQRLAKMLNSKELEEINDKLNVLYSEPDPPPPDPPSSSSSSSSEDDGQEEELPDRPPPLPPGSEEIEEQPEPKEVEEEEEEEKEEPNEEEEMEEEKPSEPSPQQLKSEQIKILRNSKDVISNNPDDLNHKRWKVYMNHSAIKSAHLAVFYSAHCRKILEKLDSNRYELHSPLVLPNVWLESLSLHEQSLTVPLYSAIIDYLKDIIKSEYNLQECEEILCRYVHSLIQSPSIHVETIDLCKDWLGEPNEAMAIQKTLIQQEEWLIQKFYCV